MYSWFMLIITGFFYAYQFIIRVSPNMMTDELSLAFQLDGAQLGMFTSCFYITYTASLIPLGLMMDRIGPRILFVCASALLGMACFLFSSTTDFQVACAARLLMGVGAANGFLGSLKVASLWLPAKDFGKAVGIVMVFGTLGAILGGAPFEFLLNYSGWQNTLYFLGAVGIVLALFFGVFLKDKPTDGAEEDLAKVWDCLVAVVREPQTWKAAFFGMTMYLPIIIVGDLWGVSFAERAYDVDEIKAATYVSMMFVGVALGSPGFAVLSDLIGSRLRIMSIGACGSLACFFAMIYLPISWDLGRYILFFASGAFLGTQAICFTTNVEFLPKKLSGLVVGVTNSVVMSCGIFSLPLVGGLLDYHRGQQIVGMNYSFADFQFAFVLVLVSLGVALVLTTRLKETYTTNDVK